MLAISSNTSFSSWLRGSLLFPAAGSSLSCRVETNANLYGGGSTGFITVLRLHPLWRREKKIPSKGPRPDWSIGARKEFSALEAKNGILFHKNFAWLFFWILFRFFYPFNKLLSFADCLKWGKIPSILCFHSAMENLPHGLRNNGLLVFANTWLSIEHAICKSHLFIVCHLFLRAMLCCLPWWRMGSSSSWWQVSYLTTFSFV